MKPILSLCLLAFVCSCRAQVPMQRYVGMCDASAAVALDDTHFVVADDEANILQIYKRNDGSRPAASLDVSGFLNDAEEADLEGATASGGVIYWIASHGANKKGKPETARQQLFATKMVGRTLQPIGQPYTGLLSDLAKHPGLSHLRIDRVLPPKEAGALNIEGLCDTPEGHLLIGFRNPIPQGRALILPLLNPAQTIQGAPPELGQPIWLELGGLGVRSLERVGDEYLILAGSFSARGDFALFRWNGKTARPQRVEAPALSQMNPEALVHFSGSNSILVLSDDGAQEINGVPCKKIKDPLRKSFRAVDVEVPHLKASADLFTQARVTPP